MSPGPATLAPCNHSTAKPITRPSLASVKMTEELWANTAVIDPLVGIRLNLDGGDFPRPNGKFDKHSHMAFIPSPDWKGWKELAKQDGLEGAAILGPAKRSWRCGYVFDVLPVDKKAIIAIVNVFFVDETSEKPDVGISLAWERPWRKAALRMRRLLDWQKRA
ncbi:uncharacterized protein VDAG_01141 [Verticillium dahliae VdLs.17]|uniref:Uncharacterized protein n=1 Tax=Verticillium dahliae (strain VdLs.17 / ATCC MYA-4575 / FGSC 10137) TaxID=498257 RepID=G2WTL8_VERDV|nr:uncharacterized protein VDAG_01141 [Verticillium dahliae VdLs.17]EGY17459.1 hypothetical protein VDAG_01141 [Verticillium dahliae VdLs.17]KAH6691079.1 hypothetical protein EV126DRAFT_462891 [Verticillium dahliae]